MDLRIQDVVLEYSASYNASNQLTEVVGPAGTTTYTYDDTGNTASASDGTDISYDLRNRATSVK